MAENGSFQKYTSYRRGLAQVSRIEALYKFDEDTGELTKHLNGSVCDLTDEEIQECENMRKCKQKQRKTIEKHMQFLFERAKNEQSRLFFATFDFNDDALIKKADTRKQKVRRTLSNVADDYIMNIDYGEKKGREHYHAIVELPKNDSNFYLNEYGHIKHKIIDDLYDFGNYDLEEVRLDDIDKKRLARYMNKLVFHSVKVAQTYVSVKKGSRYQQLKKKQEQVKRLGRSRGVRKQVERMDENYLQMDSLDGTLPWY